MKKTTNYDLNQWDAEDRVTREDFNADNAAIDAALTALAGGAKVAYGSYVGNGGYGSNGRVILTFDFEPKVLILMQSDSSDRYPNAGDILFFTKSKYEYTYPRNGSQQRLDLFFDENRIFWYILGGKDASAQFNADGKIYCYAVFG